MPSSSSACISWWARFDNCAYVMRGCEVSTSRLTISLSPQCVAAWLNISHAFSDTSIMMSDLGLVHVAAGSRVGRTVGPVPQRAGRVAVLARAFAHPRHPVAPPRSTLLVRGGEPFVGILGQ